eukprot:4305668-Karenia_brevis.AAC.1
MHPIDHQALVSNQLCQATPCLLQAHVSACPLASHLHDHQHAIATHVHAGAAVLVRQGVDCMGGCHILCQIVGQKFAHIDCQAMKD